MKFVLKKEADLSGNQREQLALLLSRSFPGYPEGRIYYKQLPTFRVLLKKKKHILAHAAIDHRIMKVGDELVQVWGITDFCVDENVRLQGHGGGLMEHVIKGAEKADVDFLVLTSGDSAFYKKFGFTRKKARAKWVMIHDDHLFGIQDRMLEDALYVRPIARETWPIGNVDFLGTMF